AAHVRPGGGADVRAQVRVAHHAGRLHIRVARGVPGPAQEHGRIGRGGGEGAAGEQDPVRPLGGRGGGDVAVVAAGAGAAVEGADLAALEHHRSAAVDEVDVALDHAFARVQARHDALADGLAEEGV